MKKEFIPYEQALALKELGFNEPCFGFYYLYKDENHQEGKFDYRGELNIEYSIYKENTYYILAPTYSQAFSWFRENYNLYSSINIYNDLWICIIKSTVSSKNEVSGYVVYAINKGYPTFKTYEKAELNCLNKLIELTLKSE
jgi:hypothetical protein